MIQLRNIELQFTLVLLLLSIVTSSKVLIIGGGTTGLSAALILEAQGWNNIAVLEKLSKYDLTNKNKLYEFDQRGMELFNLLDLNTQLKQYFSKEIGSYKSKSKNLSNSNNLNFSVLIPQPKLIQILLSKIELINDENQSEKIKLMYSTNVESFEKQVNGSIKTFIRSDDHNDNYLDSDIIIGCDGENSVVREIFSKPSDDISINAERVKMQEIFYINFLENKKEDKNSDNLKNNKTIVGTIILLGESAHVFPSDLKQGVNFKYNDIFTLHKMLEKHKNEIDKALPEFESIRISEAEDLARLVQIEASLKSKSIIKNILRRLNMNFRLTLSRWFPKIFHPPIEILIKDSSLSYHEVLTRYQATTRRLIYISIFSARQIAACFAVWKLGKYFPNIFKILRYSKNFLISLIT